MSDKHPALADPNRLWPVLLEDTAVYLVLADGYPVASFATYVEAQRCLGECRKDPKGKKYTTTSLTMRPSPAAQAACILVARAARFRLPSAKAPVWHMDDPTKTVHPEDRGFQGVELDCGVEFNIEDLDVPQDWRYGVSMRWQPLGEMQRWMYDWVAKRLRGDA